MKECNLKKLTFTKDKGLFAKMQKAVFLVCFLVVLFFFSSVFLCLCPKKAIFLRFERFFYFCSPKGLSLKSFFSSYSVFFFGFPFSRSYFSLLFVHQPLFRKHYYFGFLSFFFFLPFPFQMFACFFETNFPNIPFFKPRLLSFLAGYFSVVVFVFVFMVYVSAFLFLCWFCFW